MLHVLLCSLIIFAVTVNANERYGGYVASFPSDAELQTRINEFTGSLPTSLPFNSLKALPVGVRNINGNPDIHAGASFYIQPNADSISLDLRGLSVNHEIPGQLILEAKHIYAHFGGDYKLHLSQHTKIHNGFQRQRTDLKQFDQAGTFETTIARLSYSAKIGYYVDYETGVVQGGAYLASDIQRDDAVQATVIEPALERLGDNVLSEEQLKRSLYKDVKWSVDQYLKKNLLDKVVVAEFVVNDYWQRLEDKKAEVLSAISDTLSGRQTVVSVVPKDGSGSAEVQLKLALNKDANSGFSFVNANEGFFWTTGLRAHGNGKVVLSRGSEPLNLRERPIWAKQSFEVQGDLSDPSSIEIKLTKFESNLRFDDWTGKGTDQKVAKSLHVRVHKFLQNELATAFELAARQVFA